jgi:ABC-type amino acid transport substrate-binding protein
MDKRDFLKLIASAAVVAPVTVMATCTKTPQTAGDAVTTPVFNVAFERMLKTGEMVCGYIDYKMYSFKDPLTGKMGGIFYELTQKIAKQSNLKTRWVETNFETLTEDIRNGKFDVFCGGLWPSLDAAKVIRYSLPTFYAGLGVYVRANDSRFDSEHDLAKLNSPFMKLATLDGEMSQIVQTSDFPQASVLSHPASADITSLPLAVMTRKADATIIENAVALEFMTQHPGVLKNLAESEPVRLFENTYAFGQNEFILKEFFDVAIKEMVFSGLVRQLVRKYEPAKGSFLLPATPFQTAA